MRFWYHMFGGSIGTLNIYTEGTGVPKANQFTRSGDQGNTWTEASFDIPSMPDLKVRKVLSSSLCKSHANSVKCDAPQKSLHIFIFVIQLLYRSV